MDEPAKSTTRVHGSNGDAYDRGNAIQAGEAPARPLSIREVAAMTEVTVHTLRYYERIGLLAGVPRSESGHRRYREDDVRWVIFLRKMHATGMPIRGMQEYARLLRRGPSTARERRLLLEAHRAEVKAQIAGLQANLDMIEKKIAFYEDMERETAKLAPSDPAREPHRFFNGKSASSSC